MVGRETSKQRTSRIALDYFKRPDGMTRRKRWLSVSCTFIALVWLAAPSWDVREWPVKGLRTYELASHGELARAHATWDNECEACHVPGKPIDGSGWIARYVTGPHTGDDRCVSCHQTAGHHQEKSKTPANSCASCHRDHRGREASLIAVPDRNCTSCHVDMSTRLNTGMQPEFAEVISRFDSNPLHHPEFKLFRDGNPKDPGRIKFSHMLHMSKGLTLEPDGKPLRTLGSLAPEDRSQYAKKGMKDDEGIQLGCDNCHESGPSSNLSAKVGVPSLGSSVPLRYGGYMRPIRFESDCRACHPLDFAPRMPAVGHGVQPVEVKAELTRLFASQFLDENREFPRSKKMPGPDDTETRKARESVRQKVLLAERVLYGEKRCGECHVYEKNDGGGEIRGFPDNFEREDFKIAASNIPNVWFLHAAFDHSAHSALGCGDCHPQAFPDDRNASKVSADVLIPQSSLCLKCHGPQVRSTKIVSGGANNSCTECHKYHCDDERSLLETPLRRDASADENIKRFLRGKVKSSGTL